MLEKDKNLETAVATLILITSAVIFACVVVDYAVAIIQQTLDMENIPQLGRIRDFESNILNQTESFFNQTQPGLPNQPLP